MNYREYRTKVLLEIERRLGGKVKFLIEEFVVEMSYDKKHHYTVPAKVIIQAARKEAKASRP